MQPPTLSLLRDLNSVKIKFETAETVISENAVKRVREHKDLHSSPFRSATVNPAPLSFPVVTPYARTPTGQGVDCLVSGVTLATPKKGTVSAKADTTLFRLPILHPQPLH
mgnify:CR=1 FL=1